MTDPYTSPTNVDLSYLEQAAGFLDQIAQFVQTHCLDTMAAIHNTLGAATNVHLPDLEYQFTRQATFFGGFYSAYGVQASHDSIYRAVQDSLTSITKDLGQAAEATRTIVQDYRTVEERNTAMADDIRRALGDPSPSPASPVSTGYANQAPTVYADQAPTVYPVSATDGTYSVNPANSNLGPA